MEFIFKQNIENNQLVNQIRNQSNNQITIIRLYNTHIHIYSYNSFNYLKIIVDQLPYKKQTSNNQWANYFQNKPNHQCSISVLHKNLQQTKQKQPPITLLHFSHIQIVATLIQFKRLANVYFLITAILQFIPVISPLSPVSAIAPLIFVLLVSLIRAGVQEIGKYQYDRQANSSKFLVYNQHNKQYEKQNEKSQEQSDVDQSIQIQSIWELKRSDQLYVGNIVKVQNNQRFPADILLLSTSNLDGKAYIQTSSLDGQKNLKIRTPLSSTQSMYCSLQQIIKTNKNKPFLTIQQPSQQLYTFNAMLQYTRKLQKPVYGNRNKKQQKISQFIKISQFLYRDAVLRNTQYIIGVIIGVGKHTKSMMNNINGIDKMSKLQRKVNFYMVFIFILQLCLIILCGLLQILLFYQTFTGQVFIKQVLNTQPINYIKQAAITSASYFILLNTMIPISLLVSIQIVKFGQSYFISYDKLMSKKDQKLGVINSKAFRSSINQELGMVQYVFTDKTGTLTKNQMVLKEVMIGYQNYSNQYNNSNKYGIDSIKNNKKKNINNINNKDYYSNNQLKQKCANSIQQISRIFSKIKQNHQYTQQGRQISQQNHILSKQNQRILNTLMITIMATCHQCLLVSDKHTNNVKQDNHNSNSNNSNSIENSHDQYHGSSPDQITLVDSACRIGYKFIDNLYGKIKISLTNNSNNNDKYLQLKVLDIFQFNSDRKRMSIILQSELLTGYKILFCKGADSIIDKLLTQKYHKQQKSIQYQCYNNIKQQVNQYSKIGLRTLLFGYKLIPNGEYGQIKKKLMEYTDINNNSHSNNNSNNNNTKQQIITNLQQNLQLCGATAVQDKLQDEVQQVIQDLLKANIKVCMLTGDKLQTAQNIAKSCNLIKQNWKIIRIIQNSSNVDIFRGYCIAKDYIEMKQRYGVLIEGEAIDTAINSIYFKQIIQNCQAAVCCRITPKNKAQVVNFAKQNLGKLVLSIGDGANDVPMIQSANIGIGLYGNQGMNAVQASDFAIPQFKCLWRLLFVHGRWNYLRIAQLVKYFFYKNIVFTLGQLWYAYVCNFSGTSIYDATYLVLFNTIFTGGPVIIRALLQQDLNYLQIIQEIQQQSKIKISQSSYLHTNQLNKQLLQNQSLSNTNNNNNNNSISKPSIHKFTSLNTIKSITKSQLENNQLNFSLNKDKMQYKNKNNQQQSTIKTIMKVTIDNTMKQLFPRLYTHSQQQQSLTPRIFFLLILQSIIQSFGIFLSIYFGFKVPELWLFSICLYSVIIGLVTIRICYDIMYWTWLIVVVILFTSILPYVLFVYVMSLFQPFLAGTFVQLFKLPNFYLCLGLALGVGAFIQATFNIIRKYYFPTTVDSIRKQWKNIQKQKDLQQRSLKQSRKLIRTRTMQSKYLQILKSNRSISQQMYQTSPINSINARNVEIELKQIKKQKRYQ